MTRLITTLICSLFCVISAAQKDSAGKHLTFMDIPICGKPNQFVKQMTKQGFMFREIINEKTILMKGSYGGYDDCDTYIYVSDSNTVNSVAVALPFRNTWAELSDDYFKMKDMLTKRYGIADYSNEKFENPDIQEDWKMMYVNTDRCEYKSAFKRDHGMIAVSITHTSLDYVNYNNVRIFYIDSPGAGDVGKAN